MTGVKAFYQFYYIELPKIKSDKAKTLRPNKDIPTKEDIQDVLKTCDPLLVILEGSKTTRAPSDEVKTLIDNLPKNRDTQEFYKKLDELKQSKSEMLLQKSSALVSLIGFAMQILQYKTVLSRNSSFAYYFNN